MEFSRGNPPEARKYLTYVKDLGSPGWLKPAVLSWEHGRWRFPQSNSPYWEPVFLWNGPLPCGKLDEFVLTKMDYDL